jgi:hypothetical protein
VTGIANPFVEGDELLHIVDSLWSIEVYLVEDKFRGDSVGLCCGEEAIDEGRTGLRCCDSADEEGRIDVCCQDMGLLREVCGSTDDVVLAGEDILDVEGLFLRLA